MGARFWPASRRKRPKPFVPLMGLRTLFDQTLSRSRAFAPPERTWVVAADQFRGLLRSELAGRPGVHSIFEPVPRNTAAAVAWAAATVLGRSGPALLAVLPADHHIPDRRAFARTIRQAATLAHRRDAVVLLGIEPTRPDPAYGYLRVEKDGTALAVRRFVEKPDVSRARRYVREGKYLWNSGIVVGPATRIIEEVRSHAPEVWGPLGKLIEQAALGRRVARRSLARAYARVKPLSFDYAVLERTRGVLAVRGRFAWSDLGSWNALKDHLPKLAFGNQALGPPPVLLDSHDNLLWNASGRTTVLLGVSGLVVIETRDALLVCTPERAQEVRRVVETLTRRGRKGLT